MIKKKYLSNVLILSIIRTLCGIVILSMTIQVSLKGQNGSSEENALQSEFSNPVPQGIIRNGFDLTFYSDRKPNKEGGLLHGWGPLAFGAHNPSVDMILVQIHWNQTHTGPNQADFSFVDRQIDSIFNAGKKVYLYPHPAFPPAWAKIKIADNEWGFIDYFDPASHVLQLQWYELIAKKYGKDNRVTAIRMSTFDHGETAVHETTAKGLNQQIAKNHLSAVEFSQPLVLDIYKVFLKYSDPKKLLAHGGGLQGDCLNWAVKQGTGHETGTHQQDFAGVNQFARRNSATLKNGHLTVKTMKQEGLSGLYIAESQCWPGWEKNGNLDSIKRYMLTLFCSHIVHGTNYILLDEMIYNRQNYRRLSPWAPISPDWTGRLIRRGDESAKVWNDDPEVYQAAMWERTLLGTTDETTPEAFVQTSSHYVAELKDSVMAFEHGMRMDFDRSKAIPVMKGNLLIEADYVGGIFGNRESHFAKASPHFYFSLNEGFQKSLLHRRGELLEVRVSYRDIGNGSFNIFYQQQANGLVSARKVALQNSDTWRTACFLLVDPDITEGKPFDIEVKTEDGKALIVCLIRVIKQYD